MLSFKFQHLETKDSKFIEPFSFETHSPNLHILAKVDMLTVNQIILIFYYTALLMSARILSPLSLLLLLALSSIKTVMRLWRNVKNTLNS